MMRGSVSGRGRLVAMAAGVWFAGAWMGAALVQAQEVPFDAVVAQDDVVVRAGAGNAYYEVGRVERGTGVRVEEILYGWNRIQPPEGVYSYVSKMNVDARGDGRIGEVNSNRVSVTAASVSGPGQSYRRQVVLNEGDTVRIVGEDGSFYKIEPPEGAPVYLPPGAVYRADSEQGMALRGEREAAGAFVSRESQGAAEATEPAEASAAARGAEAESDPDAGPSEAAPALEPADRLANTLAGDAAADAAIEAGVDTTAAAVRSHQPTEADVDTEAVADADTDTDTDAEADGAASAQAEASGATDAAEAVEANAAAQMAEADVEEAEAIETTAVSGALRAVEMRNLPLLFQPLEDQPIDRMIAEYQRVLNEAEALPASDRRLIRMRLAELERNQRLAEALLRIAEVRQRSEQREAEIEPVRLTERSGDDYDVIGRLLASGVYDGRTLPRMFRLVDPGSGRTIAYIEPNDPVQPHRMLGRMVGVKGQRQYHQAMGLYVFKVRQIDTLEVAAGR